MKRVLYDLHLHSCLSPCANDDMTPNNIVHMAALLGFDLIALTDHNTCGNTPAIVEAGRQAGISVVPGMELCTAEEAHVICLFPLPDAALAFEEEIAATCPPIENKPEIFGKQVVLDATDAFVREEKRLLLCASGIGVNQVLSSARKFGGTAFPAHVDRGSYSVIASLGAIPPEAGFQAAEISPQGEEQALLESNPELSGLLRLCSSDAHTLENMRDPHAWVELEECSPQALIAALDGRQKARWRL